MTWLDQAAESAAADICGWTQNDPFTHPLWQGWQAPVDSVWLQMFGGFEPYEQAKERFRQMALAQAREL